MAKNSRSRQAPPNMPKVPVAPASPDGPNRKVRKDEARRQREALQRKIGRRKFYRWGLVGLVVVVVAGAGTVIALNQSPSPKPKKSPSGVLTGLQTGTAPWGQGQAGLHERIQAIGLPFGAKEQLAFHIHDLVQIYVNGKSVPVPPDIGINYPAPQDQIFLAVLHTHDASGIVHIESPVQRDYTLGQFFDVWGVRFSSTCIGGYCTSGNKQLRVYLDGKAYPGDPRGLVFKQHEDIVVTYGTKGQLPTPIPSTYSSTLSPSCSGSC